MTPIKFRPHHFLCTLGFQGKGYSLDFVKNYQNITDLLNSDQGNDTPIEVTHFADDICTACPERRAHLCSQQEKIESLDQRHSAALKLQNSDILLWKEAKERIAKNITPAIFDKICEGCGWKSLGLCKAALEKLLSD